MIHKVDAKVLQIQFKMNVQDNVLTLQIFHSHYFYL